ncbi:DUF4920 domain-containing protein [Flavobacteriales bacterium]|jgi:hypothetical protein|nr:DUF4920 domain-containing protein [Flavobacteriales bacterium]MDO7741948.1 DUF4920 domain-containing protein [Flavobacteriales bacterium]
MKNAFLLPLVLVCLSSCNSDSSEQTASIDDTTVWTSYGEPIADLSTPVSASEVVTLMDAGGSGQGLFDAEIVQSCMTMGCWMSVKGPQGDTVMVFMKDHAFFVPKDSVQGKRALFSGEAYYDTLSVEFQKHLLEDAGADQAAIDAVSEPVFELAFEASGVQIADVPEGAPMAGE